MKIKLFILILMLLPELSEAKKLTLLYDAGNSTIYNKGLDSKIRVEMPDPIEMMDSMFPVESKLWILSEFESVHISFPEMRSPVFLVGCDDISLGWVEHRRELFEKNRALGFVINCPSADDYNAFKANIYPIIVQPSNMDKLATHLNHYQYPAYIHSRAIEQ